MHILHLLAPGAVGGLERVVQALALGQQARGCRVTVVAILDADEADHPFVAPLREAGITVLTRAYPGRQYRRERREVAELVQGERPDVVHTHGYRTDVVSGTAVRALGIPTVTTVHGFTGGGWKNRFYEWLQRRAFRRFDAVVAVSRPLVERLARSGVPRERIHLLPNGWAGMSAPPDPAVARRELGVAENAFHIGWVGRLSAEKGADVLVDAVPNLPPAAYVVSFLGDGRERLLLQSRAAALGVEGAVRWHGIVPDAGRLFSAFDVFVLSSHTEGTPIALFEAMAAGVPIVATRVGGVPDVVSEREAILVPPGNPRALAGAIDAVRREPMTARERAERARARLAAQFGVEPWLDGYEAVYRSSTGVSMSEELV